MILIALTAKINKHTLRVLTLIILQGVKMQWPTVNLQAVRVVAKVLLAAVLGTTADELLLDGSLGLNLAEALLQLFGL